MAQYEVYLTVRMLIEASNVFAAEAEAADLVHIIPAVVHAQATKSKISKYMKS